MAMNNRTPPHDPNEVRRQFEAILNDLRIDRRSAAADEIQKRLMRLYEAGIRDRALCVALLFPSKRAGVYVCKRGSKPH